MKTKTPKNSPVAVLYTAAKEIVDGTRKVFAQQGQDGREIRLPILMHGTDMRVTIEAGPKIAARNAIEHAQMEASGEPVEPIVDMSRALNEAMALLALYAVDLDAEHSRMQQEASAEWHRTKDYAARCRANIAELKKVEHLL